MRPLEKSSAIASSISTPIYLFIDLVKKIAKLSFENKDSLLFYRGQRYDYENKAGNSSFYPSIYRTTKENLSRDILEIRFKKLEYASKLLITKLEALPDIDGSIKELKNRKYIRWSILQHYEVCDTPLLDLTQSIRVASSFALLNKAPNGFFYVFALPYITNRISINSEHDIVNIRLINICPPLAFRPYFQEGYLVGTDDITTDFDVRSDLDFKQRLVAKFELHNSNDEFWGEQDSIEQYLKPKNDEFENICNLVKNEILEENNLELIFPGKWLNSYQFADGRNGEEIFEIKNVNEYYVNGAHIFNIDSVLINKEKNSLEFRKVGVDPDKRKAFNSLTIINDNLYKGIETTNTQISYSRIDG